MPRPDAHARLLERIDDAIGHGDARTARRLLDKLERDGPTADTRFLRWSLLSLQEDPEAVLTAAIEGAAHHPEVPELQYALGLSLADMDRGEEAIIAFEEACFLDPDYGEAWHALAWAREAAGDRAGARTAFGRVWDLDMAEPLPPLRYPAEWLERLVQRTLKRLPADIREAVAEVPIFIEDYPERWIVEEEPWDPRLLGMFDGPTHAELRGIDVTGAPRVYLFQRNLEQVCPDDRTMAEQVRVTLVHELGHYLGLGEDALHARGLA